MNRNLPELYRVLYTFASLPPPIRWSGSAAQAWFLRWIKSCDPEMARALHDEDGRKPYTLSIDPVAGKLRITTLDPTLAKLILESSSVPPLRLFEYETPLIKGEDQHYSYAGLVSMAESLTFLPMLEFRSPTLFRSDGLDVPFPLPSLVFGSLARAWDRFAPLPLPDQIGDFVRRHVNVWRYRLSTRAIPTPHKGKRIGFLGAVHYRVDLAAAAADPVTFRLIGALTGLAAFAGVGVGTTAGFGYTEPQPGFAAILASANIPAVPYFTQDTSL